MSATTSTAIVLDDTTNQAVVKMATRRYPGVLVQGDSMKALHDELAEAANAIRDADFATAAEGVNAVLLRLADLLRHYESVLDRAGVELPYARPR